MGSFPKPPRDRLTRVWITKVSDGMKYTDNRGFTLIEIIVVVAIMVVFYTYGMPKFNSLSGTEATTKVNRLAADIRSAYDLAVLSNRPYRIVFMVLSGDYYLETADGQSIGGAVGGLVESLGLDAATVSLDMAAFNRMPFFLADEKKDRDLSIKGEKDLQTEFDATFDEYKDLAGSAVEDNENDRVLNPRTPLMSAKEWLRPPRWNKVNSAEWGKSRSIGSYMAIKDIQIEHQDSRQSLHGSTDADRVMLYFFPRGYVERACIHIGVRRGESDIEENEKQYTIITHPYLGTAEVRAGYEEVNLLDES